MRWRGIWQEQEKLTLDDNQSDERKEKFRQLCLKAIQGYRPDHPVQFNSDNVINGTWEITKIDDGPYLHHGRETYIQQITELYQGEVEVGEMKITLQMVPITGSMM